MLNYNKDKKMIITSIMCH